MKTPEEIIEIRRLAQIKRKLTIARKQKKKVVDKTLTNLKS
jgi:hypothetical protein